MPSSVVFTHQSHDISFSDWVTLLTLCLAPLIAHVAAGVPSVVYLHARQPRWHDRMCLYNPTSILWRYLAIVDRRSRAVAWSALDMAASNALFWDGYKWDGSEEMIQRTRDFCVRSPGHHHVDLLSGSTIVTIIVTLQGIQAMYSLIHGSIVTSAYSATVAINTVFYPLASLSLLRLPAALWLTNDYIYRDHEIVDPSETFGAELRPNIMKQSDSASSLIVQPTMSSLQSPVGPSQFDHRSWLSVVVRFSYLLMVMGLLALCLYEFCNGFQSVITFLWPATNFSLVLTFMLLLAVTTGTLLTYVTRRGCRTTVIPCITAGWYKMYTILLFAMMLSVFIIAALETRKTPCGVYTTYAYSSGLDRAVCGPSLYIGSADQDLSTSLDYEIKKNGSYVSQAVPFTNVYGMALAVDDGDLVVVAFDGWCKLKNPITTADISLFQRSISQPANLTLRG